MQIKHAITFGDFTIIHTPGDAMPLAICQPGYATHHCANVDAVMGYIIHTLPWCLYQSELGTVKQQKALRQAINDLAARSTPQPGTAPTRAIITVCDTAGNPIRITYDPNRTKDYRLGCRAGGYGSSFATKRADLISVRKLLNDFWAEKAMGVVTQDDLLKSAKIVRDALRLLRHQKQPPAFVRKVYDHTK